VLRVIENFAELLKIMGIDAVKWGMCKFLLTFCWTICLSCTIPEIVSVEYWHALEVWVRGHSRSLTVAPFSKSYTTVDYKMINWTSHNITLMWLYCLLSLTIVIANLQVMLDLSPVE